MTPQEKAKELVNKFNLVNSKNYIDDNGLWDTEFVLTNDDAKECALIAVNEIIKAMRKGIPEIGFGTGYWSDVRKEIEKL